MSMTLRLTLGQFNTITHTRGAPDPEFCYPAGSGSMLDPEMSDPTGSGSCRIGIQTSTTADNRRQITLSAPLLEKLE